MSDEITLEQEIAEELKECSTKRRKWWAIQFEDESFFGEVDEDDGFTLNLYNTKKDAHEHAHDFLEGAEVFYRIVEICWSVVSHRRNC